MSAAAYMGAVNAPLYNTRILRLAASIPHHERLDDPMASVERRSPICGSRVTVDVDTDAEGRVSRLGLLVRACALGQASASLMAEHAIGRSGAELATARDTLSTWLAGEGEAPDWPDLSIFEPARPHRARHPSILLAFEAAAEAAERAAAARKRG